MSRKEEEILQGYSKKKKNSWYFDTNNPETTRDKGRTNGWPNMTQHDCFSKGEGTVEQDRAEEVRMTAGDIHYLFTCHS